MTEIMNHKLFECELGMPVECSSCKAAVDIVNDEGICKCCEQGWCEHE
jgi:hypothetical protein